VGLVGAGIDDDREDTVSVEDPEDAADGKVDQLAILTHIRHHVRGIFP
jgi:hypothetical protein